MFLSTSLRWGSVPGPIMPPSPPHTRYVDLITITMAMTIKITIEMTKTLMVTITIKRTTTITITISMKITIEGTTTITITMTIILTKITIAITKTMREKKNWIHWQPQEHQQTITTTLITITMISDNISTTPRQCKHRTVAAHNIVYGLKNHITKTTTTTPITITMIFDNISTTPWQCKHRTVAAHNNVYGLNNNNDNKNDNNNKTNSNSDYQYNTTAVQAQDSRCTQQCVRAQRKPKWK